MAFIYSVFRFRSNGLDSLAKSKSRMLALKINKNMKFDESRPCCATNLKSANQFGAGLEVGNFREFQGNFGGIFT